MTATELRSRIKCYRETIAYWQRLLEVGYDDQLQNDIRDLESWINLLCGETDSGPIERRTKRRAGKPDWRRDPKKVAASLFV